MKKIACARSAVLVLLALLAAEPLRAAIRDITASALPQTPAVAEAVRTLVALEPFVDRFYATWQGPMSEPEALAQLNVVRAALAEAQKTDPRNVQLLLLRGLAAHYACNLDAPGSWDESMKALQQAGVLAPSDPRPRWFAAVNQCQSTLTVQGMRILLGLEQDADAPSAPALPADFWVDYAECAEVTHMPVHAQRALDRAAGAVPDSPWGQALTRAATAGIEASRADAGYKALAAWSVTPEVQGGFTSTLCGAAFVASSSWDPRFADPGNGSCTVQIGTGPYQGMHRSPRPTLLLAVKSAPAGQSVEEYFAQILGGGKYTVVSHPSLRCPVAPCLTAELRSDTAYTDEGGGHFLVTVFATRQHPYAGLALERPHPLPNLAPNGQSQFIHPEPILKRYPGTLFYMVLVDSTSSVYSQARADFLQLLNSLTIDAQ